MKHIVIDARESGTTTGRYVDNLLLYLHNLRSDYKITVLTKPHRVKFLKKVVVGFDIKPTTINEFGFAEQTLLLNQVNKLNPDLVHFTIVQQPIFYKGSVVTTMHDLTTLRFINPLKNIFVFKFKQWVYGRVNKIVAKKSKAIIVPSNYVKQDILKYTGVAANKVQITYESADEIKQSAKEIKLLTNKKYIMYVGRPQPHKNLKRLISTHQKLLARFPDLILVLVGKKDKLFEQIESQTKIDSCKNIIFTDFVSDGELRWLYENAEAYVLPSLSEGFGLPGLEAMAHGCPLISSSATCLPEIYGDAAHYFDPESVEDMSVKIGEVLDNKKLRQKLIANGHKQIKKYSWEKMAKETLAVYKKVLEK